MASDSLVLAQAAIQIGSAALYLWVARIVVRRDVEPHARRANAAFAAWWFAFGFAFMLIPFLNLPSRVFGYENIALSVTLLNAILILIVIAIWGLVYYLVYLYTGSRKSFWPLAVFYAILGFLLLFLVAYLAPNGYGPEGQLTYTREQLSGAPSVTIGLLFSLPVVIAAIAYGSLFFRVKNVLAKYRIGLVSAAFLLQFGWSALSAVLQLSARYPNSIWLSLLSNALGAIAAVAVIMAFHPPRPVRRRFKLLEAEGA